MTQQNNNIRINKSLPTRTKQFIYVGNMTKPSQIWEDQNTKHVEYLTHEKGVIAWVELFKLRSTQALSKKLKGSIYPMKIKQKGHQTRKLRKQGQTIEYTHPSVLEDIQDIWREHIDHQNEYKRVFGKGYFEEYEERTLSQTPPIWEDIPIVQDFQKEQIIKDLDL